MQFLSRTARHNDTRSFPHARDVLVRRTGHHLRNCGSCSPRVFALLVRSSQVVFEVSLALSNAHDVRWSAFQLHADVWAHMVVGMLAVVAEEKADVADVGTIVQHIASFPTVRRNCGGVAWPPGRFR